MDIASKRQVPYNPEAPGIRSKLTLWALYPPIADMSFSSCSSIAIRCTRSLCRLAINSEHG